MGTLFFQLSACNLQTDNTIIWFMLKIYSQFCTGTAPTKAVILSTSEIQDKYKIKPYDYAILYSHNYYTTTIFLFNQKWHF